MRARRQAIKGKNERRKKIKKEKKRKKHRIKENGESTSKEHKGASEIE